MIWVHMSSVVVWIMLGVCLGLFVGVRMATYVHYKRLKGALCEKCVKGFWNRYNDDSHLL